MQGKTYPNPFETLGISSAKQKGHNMSLYHVDSPLTVIVTVFELWISLDIFVPTIEISFLCQSLFVFHIDLVTPSKQADKTA